MASGIGITPAMSLVTTHKATRRANLIWTCRDASLVEFYLATAQWGSGGSSGWTLIFYTGKRRLMVDSAALPETVMIFRGRPDLQVL